MSHTLTASLKQALLSLGFLIAFTGRRGAFVSGF